MRKTIAVMLTCALLVMCFAACSCSKQPDEPTSFSPSGSEVSDPTALPSASDTSGTQNGVSDATQSTSVSSVTDGGKTTAVQGRPNTSGSKATKATSTVNTTKVQTNTEVPTMDKFAWDTMKKKGGAETLAISMRKQIWQTKDTLKVSGTTYYFSENGSDQNDGKTPQTAIKSLDRIARLPLKAGDAVLLERGSTFRIDAQINLVSGVSYGAYGTGNKPEILGSIKNYAGSDLWKKQANGLWKVAFTYPQAGQLVADDGALVGNKVFSQSAVKKNGDFYSDGKGSVYLYSTKDPNTYSDLEISCGGSMIGSNGSSVKNVTIENWCVKYAGCHGIGIVDADHITVRDCVFGWIGGDVQRPGSGDNTRLGNAIEFYNNANNILVENNWIYECYDAGITFQGTRGPFTNIVFRNNLIEYCMMSIEYWSSNENDKIRATFEGNVSRFANYGWGTMPDRIIRGAHLWSGWRLNGTDHDMQITIKNNVFDCAYSFIISEPWESSSQGEPQYTFSGNTYYQRDHVGGADKVGFGSKQNYAFFFGRDSAPTTAYDQAELEAAVKAVDPNAKEIKWLG